MIVVRDLHIQVTFHCSINYEIIEKILTDKSFKNKSFEDNEMLEDKYFTQGNVTLIVDGIVKRHAEGENAVRIKERKPWMEILNKEFHIPVDNKTTL